MDENVRNKSWKFVKNIGLKTNPNLPTIEPIVLKEIYVIRNRLFAMHGIAAMSFGWNKSKTNTWFDENHLLDYLTEEETAFLDGDESNINKFKWQIESMWALSWLVSLINELNFAKECSERFVNILPDLKGKTNLVEFSRKFTLRSISEVYEKLDLAYCLHWSVVNASLSGYNFKKIKPLPGLLERRHALEWATSDLNWSDVSLET